MGLSLFVKTDVDVNGWLCYQHALDDVKRMAVDTEAGLTATLTVKVGA